MARLKVQSSYTTGGNMDEQSRLKAEQIQRMDGWYKSEEHVFGVEPTAGVAAAMPSLKPGTVLDLGSGDGRNALYLAGKGLDVLAVDIAPTSIANLTRYAARSNLQDRVKGVIADLETYEIEGVFDNVISTFTLHFLRADRFLPLMVRMLQATAPGGINVIEDFTQDGPLYNPERPGHWIRSGELRTFYEDRGWQVLYYDERVVTAKATDENGNHIQQGAALIVAKKPTQDA